MKTTTALKTLLLVIAITMTIGCGATLPPIIVTGPTGIRANNDTYKTVRIKNVGPAYWRFWLGPDNQQIVLYPGAAMYVKLSSNFWSKCQGFWAHAYLEVSSDGRVVESSFAGEQWNQSCITGYTWVCDTGQTVGGDIVLSGVPQPQYPFPVHFSYGIPLLPIGIQGAIR